MKTNNQNNESNTGKLVQNSRRFITRVALLAIMFCSSLIALSDHLPDTGNLPAADAEKTIRKYFHFPAILLGHDELSTNASAVEVLFTTDSRGKVNFVLAKTADKMLKREIEQQFYTLSLPRFKQDVVNSVVLHFRTR